MPLPDASKLPYPSSGETDRKVAEYLQKQREKAERDAKIARAKAEAEARARAAREKLQNGGN